MKSLHIIKYAALTFLGLQLINGCSDSATDPPPPPEPIPQLLFISNREGNQEIYRILFVISFFSLSVF